ncbi:hypothetical protein [Streptomyces sp. H27-C3]|uniref:hypothetical protein n=1 Tax=Streptomyces sp. H27-C3 TaxID=3046305 RepID=UPI0024B98F8B|nr:hypothetical protein [Streptomyces sp. H27-C3]MDJ0460523.1 hypothetical protein [Streptomyces sp. H27-C3]
MAAVASLAAGVVAALITPAPSAHADSADQPLGLPISVPEIVADGSFADVDEFTGSE